MIKKLFCKHDYQFVQSLICNNKKGLPINSINIYICTKCGHIKKVRG